MPMGAVRSRSRRRPPLRTTGTLPPEGAAPAADRDRPLPVRQWPISTVIAVAAAGLAVTAADRFRVGALVVGAALLLGAALRALLPEVGMLAVRSRFTDVALLCVLGGAIVLLALMAQPHPWIHVPFLDRITGLLGRPT
ncbi:DUF3017 domain-containing protein [Streptacidiphilus sp. ASG 303]|uniref:DUF3017 domain-containing protein n=1 Tax=Streptomycetaceae TaxID=2062 RepID=UPI001E38E501|nr:DUF3017 domain-containing protein [Streptacidiphilus sp. ASG 303]MCD0481889.1 DUF3017 domain-containing protein [Streptacidiphilus sp. ASG 303]